MIFNGIQFFFENPIKTKFENPPKSEFTMISVKYEVL